MCVYPYEETETEIGRTKKNIPSFKYLWNKFTSIFSSKKLKDISREP